MDREQVNEGWMDGWMDEGINELMWMMGEWVKDGWIKDAWMDGVNAWMA